MASLPLPSPTFELDVLPLRLPLVLAAFFGLFKKVLLKLFSVIFCLCHFELIGFGAGKKLLRKVARSRSSSSDD